jgi:predicted metal-dependent HD superfamily phosphohydrolase
MHKLFLQMDRIYKTAYFYSLYEIQARENIEQELNEIINLSLRESGY